MFIHEPKIKTAILILGGLACLPLLAFAQQHITISPNLPGPLNTTPSGTSPGAYIKNFYSYALFLSGLLAFGAIVYGGIKYAIARGNPSGESEAKQWIWSALLGMLLLAGAYLILFTINPNLVNLALPSLPNVPAQTYNPNGPNPGVVGGASGGGLTQAQALAGFAPGITVKPGASVDGMQLSTVHDIDNLLADCKQASGSCSIVVTSGTDSHAAGTSHANGLKADLRPNANLDAYITSLPKAYIRSDGAQMYAYGGGFIADERNLPGVSPHWDLSGPGGGR